MCLYYSPFFTSLSPFFVPSSFSMPAFELWLYSDQPAAPHLMTFTVTPIAKPETLLASQRYYEKNERVKEKYRSRYWKKRRTIELKSFTYNQTRSTGNISGTQLLLRLFNLHFRNYPRWFPITLRGCWSRTFYWRNIRFTRIHHLSSICHVHVSNFAGV